MTEPEPIVACLCADWCTACKAYAPVFATVASQQPGWRFVWVDIEEHADTLGDDALDIENFPTLLLLRGSTPLFYGTVLPHAATLARMLDAARSNSLAPGQPCPPALARATSGLALRLRPVDRD